MYQTLNKILLLRNNILLSTKYCLFLSRFTIKKHYKNNSLSILMIWHD